ncbi:hypothetical protein [Amycolatopsis pithecellobii]|uniref:Uncharacterized protein n=1 Tax=Amycolatopsis pithecellobii TaxID=664692 RepID=A0A6N7Z689_9PSEU|nr:hypothetical protein [Amycolatopsis pithecellobii]MTD58013.1 hypothetical protein [Amycolatopsis pithecellobii]
MTDASRLVFSASPIEDRFQALSVALDELEPERVTMFLAALVLLLTDQAVDTMDIEPLIVVARSISDIP